MARKEISTVRLERQAHREARERLRLAYEYLIAGFNQAEQPVEKEVEPIPNLRRSKDEN